MVYICNIDWLEVYCLRTERFSLPNDGKGNLYSVKRDYGTRVYADIYDIMYSPDNLYCTICMSPLSAKSRGGVIDDNACHVKIANYYCYVPGAVDKFREFLDSIGLQFKSISRLDLCADLQYFLCGIAARTFIRRYAEGKYCKIGAPHGRLYFTDSDVKSYESMSFGSPQSNVLTRMYNKSLELATVKDKSYIRDCWLQSDLRKDMDVWRVEFAIKHEGRKSVDKMEGVLYDISLEDINTPEKVRNYFLYYAHHYFIFSVYAEGVSKHKTKRIDFFPDAELGCLSPIDRPRNIYSTRSDRQVVKYLLEKSRNPSLSDIERKEVINTAYSIMRKCHLVGWAYSKGLLEDVSSVIADSEINPYMTSRQRQEFCKYHNIEEDYGTSEEIK